MPDTPNSNPYRRQTGPVINEEADKIIGRLAMITGVGSIILLTVVFVLGSIASMPGTRWFKYHQPLDVISVLIFLIPFYYGIGRLYTARLEIGRDLVAKREWKQAIAALEPYDTFGARRLDRYGEAHYLLSQAHAGLKNGDKAESCRQFVLRYRPGPWADKLGGAPRVSKASDPDEKRPSPPKSKPKRRF
jgi:hypothetical protein